jgi:dipeptidyl-peptidase-4
MRSRYLFLIAAAIAFNQAAFAQKKPITLDALQEIATLPPTNALGNPLSWSPDGSRFVARQGSSLVIYDAASQSSRTLTDLSVIDRSARDHSNSEATEPQPFAWENRRVTESNVQWASSGNRILYVSAGELYMISTVDGSSTHIPSRGDASDAKLSPDGKSIAFRSNWDLYTVDVDPPNKERRLTSGGSETVRNGGLDWVYPEELDLGTAYWWSPDSKAIAYLQFDVRGEPLYPHADLRRERALYEPQRYPQAGERNSDVKLGVVPAWGGKTKWFDVGNTAFDYLIARVTWSPDAKKLYVVRPNRVQTRIELLAYDIGSRKSTKVLEESDMYWVNPGDEPQFIKNGAEFLWLSERDGFRHIYRYSSDGRLQQQLTTGSWEVTSINGIDDVEGTIYYTSSEPSPLERHAYMIGFDGSGKRQLTQGAGTHSMIMSPKAHYYLHSYSSISSPSRVTLHSSDDRELAVYRDADRRVADQYDILPMELSDFRGPDGTQFYSRLIRPANFDPTKKYPAVVLVYGGPQAQGVRNAWYGADFDQVLAHAGFVVWQMDNRGSAGRGHAFETPLFHNLGPTELADQIAGIHQLVSMGFVDPARIGIRGWSYGGFMTLNAMLNSSEFRAGAAGAPVTDWLTYDTIYTERYMGLPQAGQPESNPDGYTGTALPQRAANLKGSLLILHNYEDDNVLFQNSLHMIDALDRAGKQFELALYTQKTHGVTGPEAQHVNEAMLAFFERNLK